jgi:hypothetical protein
MNYYKLHRNEIAFVPVHRQAAAAYRALFQEEDGTFPATFEVRPMLLMHEV